MKNKKTLNGTQKLVFVPKKPVKQELVPPKKETEKNNATKSVGKKKINETTKKNKCITNAEIINSNQPDFASNFTIKNESRKNEHTEYVEYDGNDEYINQEELMHDYKNEIMYGFANENICLINGLLGGEILCDRNGEIYYEENGNKYDFVCNETEEMKVVQIGEDACDFGAVRTCYTLVKKIQN
ncbi:hypothetical protein BDAP_000607 [Binucleata daphniae]